MSAWARLSIACSTGVRLAARRERNRSRMVIAVSLALPLAACAVGPDFVPPDAPVSNNFVGANNRSIRTDHQDYRDWWRVSRSDP